jgi:hypothetical protein
MRFAISWGIIFWRFWVWTQVFVPSRQALCPHEPSLLPFSLLLFWKWGLTYCPPSLEWDLFTSCSLLLLGRQACTSTFSFYSVEMESHKYICLDWPGTIVLPISISHIGWDAVSGIFLSRLASNWSSALNLLTIWDHRSEPLAPSKMCYFDVYLITLKWGSPYRFHLIRLLFLCGENIHNTVIKDFEVYTTLLLTIVTLLLCK